MSIVPKETIEVIAQSIGISNFAPDVAPALATDVEYRVREIMQEAIKCMRHSKRTILTVDDVDTAGHKDLFYVDDKDVEFKDLIEAPLPKTPLDTGVITHWLAIEGVQPAIPENAPIEEDGLPVDTKLPVKHVLSRELQLYFDKIKELTLSRSDSILFKEALVSLATDSGIHPLVPYFTYFIADEVTRNLNDFSILFALMRVARSLLQNQQIHIEPYLHQLMPSIFTCLVAKRLGSRFSDNHWELRSFTANLVASICKRYGHVYHNLQPRVTRTLLHAFLDPTKALPQHYGAIQGLAAFGPSVVRLLILPNLEPYLRLLEPEMQLEKHKNGMKRHEAWRVYGALLCAAGICMYDQLKTFPNLLSPPTRAILKSNKKILPTKPKINPGKRKASTDNLKQQPPLKKLATDGSMGVMPINSLAVDKQGLTGGFSTSTAVGSSDVGLSSMSQQLASENISGGRREVGTRALKASAVLAQA
ncbi:hypothetical protein AAG906_035305 [Vitis piasezkii]